MNSNVVVQLLGLILSWSLYEVPHIFTVYVVFLRGSVPRCERESTIPCDLTPVFLG